MIIKKTDVLIKVEELFNDFNQDVATLVEKQKETSKSLIALKVQYEMAEKTGAILEGRTAQAREDLVRLRSIIAQANTAWDTQSDILVEERLNAVQDAKLDYFKKGYKEAFEEIKTSRSKKPRPVAEAILISRAKKSFLKEQQKAPQPKTE